MRPTHPRRTRPAPAASGAPSRICLGRLLTGAALSVAATGLATTSAAAGDFGNIRVAPDPAPPGSTVRLSTNACGDDGATATVDASSLGVGELTLNAPDPAKPQLLRAEFTVPGNAKPGNYGIGGSCDNGNELTGTVVVGKGAPKAGKGDAGHDGNAGKPVPKDRPAPADPGHREPGHQQDPDGKEPPQDHQRHVPDAGDGHQPPQDQDPQQHDPRDHDPRDHEMRDHPVQGHDQRHHDGRHQDMRHHDGYGHAGRDHHGHDGEHGPMPRGRVHAGTGGSGGVDTAQLAGGSLALVAAAGGAFYLRRRHVTRGH
ncbi:hypothetical protein [Streptomyces sp. JJ36]|uniref:hypothetical protein n=1 Tax=Streptomyces sp. JJ36 TaxID=2736645 RepID=UPI001F29C9ED|nr:hypothetical protein [Streptomyces sp. JJ36]MCF6524818.1 hypothetical protein [Streptomyces sp. JJ36]